MTIVGIGIDIVEINRIKKNMTLYPHKLANKILTDNEWIDYLTQTNQARFLAKKFAVKEAASKALGTGMSKKITFNCFENFKDKYGVPHLRLLKEALTMFKFMDIKYTHVSITDEKRYACALVIFEK